MSTTVGPADGYLLHNSLACVLRLCEGRVTTVELRNEAFVTGRVVAVDGYMNVTMREVRFVDAARNARSFDHFFVQHRLIRFAHIPVDIDIKKELHRLFDPKSKAKQPAGRGSSRGGTGRGRGDAGGRRKIEAKRQQRRDEDLKNALAMRDQMRSKDKS